MSKVIYEQQEEFEEAERNFQPLPSAGVYNIRRDDNTITGGKSRTTYLGGTMRDAIYTLKDVAEWLGITVNAVCAYIHDHKELAPKDGDRKVVARAYGGTRRITLRTFSAAEAQALYEYRRAAGNKQPERKPIGEWFYG